MRIVDQLRRGAAGVLDLLLPRACVTCERPLDAGEPGVVCGRCWARLRPLPAPRCDRCGHPRAAAMMAVPAAVSGSRASERACGWCALLPPYVRAVRSACWMPAATAGPIVHALKYDGWRAVARGMADRMARLSWPPDVVSERTALIPVPLARVRRRERGFNQSELLAIELGRIWNVPVWSTVVERGRATQTQTRLTPGERLANVAGAFRATEDARPMLRGAHIVVVDDVVTTAATLNACAGALFEAGARIISYVTFGRAPASGDRPGP